jgi:hypothetical protein
MKSFSKWLENAFIVYVHRCQAQYIVILNFKTIFSYKVILVKKQPLMQQDHYHVNNVAK